MRPRGQTPGDGQGSYAGTQTIKAVVLIAVVVLAGVLVLHHSPSSSARAPGAGTVSATTVKPHTTTPTTPPVTGPPTTTATLPPPASIKVQVLNGANLAMPLASQWTTKLKTTFGYDTLAGDNATVIVPASAIYVLTPGFVPEAQKLAQQVGLPPTAVVTTIPPPANAPIPPRDKTSANLVLVVGPELVASA